MTMGTARIVFTAAVMCVTLTAASAAQQSGGNRAEVALQAAIKIETIDGDLKAAIDAYKKVADTYRTDRAVAARALIRAGQCYEKLGEAQAKEARVTYGRVVREYADQAELVAQAQARLAALGGTGVTGGTVGPVTRRVLADASDLNGVLSADGKYIRRLDWYGGDVIQFEIASGQTSRITNKGTRVERIYYVEGYAFSRDGKQVAFDRETRDAGSNLWVRDVDGLNLRALYSEKMAHPFDWSPAGGAILALRKGSGEAHNELVLISTADGSVRVLRSIAAAWYMLTRARFSPDGRHIAFSLVGEGRPAHGDVYLMSADGRNEVVVAGHPAEDELLDWTPDGTALLFRSDRAGTWDLWSVRIDRGKPQGEPELLRKDFGRYSRFAGMAPDGSLYYRTITPSGRLYVGEIDIDTGKVLVPPAPVTTRYEGAPSRIAWSPDGTRLLYVSFGRAMGNGNNNLTIRTVDTGEERFLATSLRNVWDIRWAPDSRSLLAWGMTVTGNALFRVDAETGELTRLADGRWAPKMSRDGKLMVYTAPQGGIRKRNLETGEDVAVEKVAVRWFEDLSPDGREVVFQDDGVIKVAPLDGGEPRELFRSPLWHVTSWTGDGRYIIAETLDSKTWMTGSPSEIRRIPVHGGTALKLDLSIAGMESFALHPDNRHFAFSVDEGTKTELWVMENLLRPSNAAK
jgi:Tol biopolymer transport system component